MRRGLGVARLAACAGLVGMGFGMGASLAQQPVPPVPPAPLAPGVLAQFRQTQCSLQGIEPTTRLIDRAPRAPVSAPAQGPTPEQAGLAGLQAQLQRPVRWTREQVLVHALGLQPSLGISVEAVRVLAAPSAARPTGPGPLLMLRVQRPEPGTLAGMALSHPCVWVVVPRSQADAWRVLLLDATAPAPKELSVRRDR